jgi:hypothetical protein
MLKRIGAGHQSEDEVERISPPEGSTDPQPTIRITTSVPKTPEANSTSGTPISFQVMRPPPTYRSSMDGLQPVPGRNLTRHYSVGGEAKDADSCSDTLQLIESYCVEYVAPYPQNLIWERKDLDGKHWDDVWP